MPVGSWIRQASSEPGRTYRDDVCDAFCEGFSTQALKGCSLEEVVDLFETVFMAYRAVNKAPVAPGSVSERVQALLTKLKPESGDG